MYCPLCKAEYRQGFTQCSDCQVPLVHSLNDAGDTQVSSAGLSEANSRDLKQIWQGLSLEASQYTRNVLEAAKIPSISGFYEPKLIRGVQGTIYWVAVRSRDWDAARAALGSDEEEVDEASMAERATESLIQANARRNPFNLEHPFWGRKEDRNPDPFRDPSTEEKEEEASEGFPPTPADRAPEELPSVDLPAEIQPEDTVAEIWSGESRDTADFVKMCLRENSIAFSVRNESGKLVIAVESSEANRAREIVREITQDSTSE
jgi:hypothetical protein